LVGWNLCKIDHSVVVRHEDNIPHRRRAAGMRAPRRDVQCLWCPLFEFLLVPDGASRTSASAPFVAVPDRSCLPSGTPIVPAQGPLLVVP
jgi:hypothetical protein